MGLQSKSIITCIVVMMLTTADDLRSKIECADGQADRGGNCRTEARATQELIALYCHIYLVLYFCELFLCAIGTLESICVISTESC